MELHIRPCLPIVMAALLGGMSSCIDNNYDLSDIDSTVRVTVNDLVIPINIDRITLSSILDIKDGDRLQIINGEYAVNEKGSFTSASISINAIHFPAPTVAPTEFEIYALEINSVKGTKANDNKLTFPIPSGLSSFDFRASDISSDIHAINRLGCNLRLNLKLSAPQLASCASSVSVQNLKLNLPKGLSFTQTPTDNYTYDSGSGEFAFIDPISLNTNGEISFVFEVNAVDASTIAHDYGSHFAEFSGEVGINSGKIVLDMSSLGLSFNPSSLNPLSMKMDYIFSAIDVTSFSGDISYQIENLNIPDIDLSDLPDVLSQDETNITLYDPKLFLSVSYPLNNYGVYASSGMTIIPIRNNEPGQSYSISDGTFNIGRPFDESGIYNSC